MLLAIADAVIEVQWDWLRLRRRIRNLRDYAARPMIASQLRTALRLLRVALHLARGACIVGLVYPLASSDLRTRLRRNWSRGLLRILNIRLRLVGPQRSIQGLLVANHVSWIDVIVIDSICNPHFVCKDDVRRWPVVGWLCEHNGTLFIDRSRNSDVLRVAVEIGRRLRTGALVTVFPEGTTSEGTGMLPFRNGLLQAAVDARATVQPLALSYLDAQGMHTTAPAYRGDDTLWQSLCSIASQPELTADVRLLPHIVCAGRTRRAVGEEAHACIRASLESPLVLRPVRPRRENVARSAPRRAQAAAE